MKALENPFSKLKDTIKIGKMPRIQQELTACLQCGYCISVCEAHGQTPWESVTPRGKIYYLKQLSGASIVDDLLGREVELSPYFVDAMYKCTGCGNCEAVCHASIPLVEFWETMRKWIVDEGAGPMAAHKAMANKVGEVHNPYGEPPSKRGDWWPEEVERSPTPDVIFFAGCTGAYRQQGLPQTGVRVLARAGVKINMLGTEEWCCSSPLLRTGTHRYSLECAEQVVEKSDGMGAKDMVMTCSGCYKTVSTDFGKFYAKTGQNVYHFSQYVERLIAEKKLPLNNEFKAKVTYHDPCHMGRHMGVFDAPRNVLKKIKGIELVEMTRSRENSRCCGAGGGYKSQYNDMAVNIAAERIRDAEETGAEILVTCCPFCVVNLTQGAKQINSKIKIMDLSEVLLKVTAPAEKPAEEKKEPPKERLPGTPTDAELAEKARLAAAEKEKAAAEAARQAALEKERAEAEKARLAALEKERAAAAEAEREARLAAAEKERAAAAEADRLARQAAIDREVASRQAAAEKEKAAAAERAAKQAADKEKDAAEEDRAARLAAIEREMAARLAAEQAAAQAVLSEKERLAKLEAESAEETITEEPEEEEGEEFGEDVWTDNSPEALVRRASWNKGLRCRKDYGPHKIPVAFVRPKVAVYILQRGSVDAESKQELEDEGWIVLSFLESDIIDGEDQAIVIKAAVKENLKAHGKKKRR